MTRAIVFGAHGFTARHLIPRLVSVENAQVVAVDIPDSPPGIGGLAAYISRDICDGDFVRRLISDYRPNWVFNLAGLTSGTPHEVYGANFTGPINILEAVREHAPDTAVLLVGSAAEYGCPLAEMLPLTEDAPCNPYGYYAISKYSMTRAAQDVARRCSLRVVVARPFNLIGAGVPESLVVGAILARAREALRKSGEAVVRIGNLDTQRDFVAVEDAVEAYLAMVKGGFWGEVFNICSGKPARIKDVVETALAHSISPVTLSVDSKLVRSGEAPVVYGSFEKARRAFGFKPRVTLRESLKRAWQHSQRNT